jgi:2-hydroxychromene-2-carboxylate isomerase
MEEASMRTTPPTARWYFDVISPFAYLHLKQFVRLPADLEVEYIPVLFAGLLNHWGHKGPAEIPAKRVHTYRYCTWAAQKRGIPFRMPPAHPFNPLSTLRLIVATGVKPEIIHAVFDCIFGEGRNVNDPTEWHALTSTLGVSNADQLITEPAVKRRLSDNTNVAIAAGVFGVPTFECHGELFWGSDTIDWMNEFLATPEVLSSPEMRRVTDLPTGAERKTRAPR